MKRFLTAVLLAVFLSGCVPAGSVPSSDAVSHTVVVAEYDQEDYTPTGKYTESFFGESEGVLAEWTHPVPDFLAADQQAAYIDAMTLWRGFMVETGYELSTNRMYELAGLTYYRDLAYDTYADFADHLRTRFSYELCNSLRTVYVPAEDAGDDETGLYFLGNSPYVEWDTRLYALPAHCEEEECPWPERFEKKRVTERTAVFDAVYPDGTVTSLSMRRTDTGWQFTEFSVPYHLSSAG